MLGLLVGLYGVLTILCGLSYYALLTQSNRRSRATIILGLTVFSLFASTTMYTVASILDCQSYLISSFATSGLSVSYNGYYSHAIDSALKTVPNLTKDYTIFQSCSSSTTLIINLLLGDAIVCWRTCVVWHQSRTVKALCGALLSVTLLVGAVDSTQSCQLWKLDPDPDISGKMGTVFEGIAIGLSACILSLSTNALATLLAACKAWQLRRRLRRYLGMGSRTSQVQKLLLLLIESGAIYCALLAVLLTFQVANLYNRAVDEPPAVYVLDIFAVITNGALIPMIVRSTPSPCTLRRVLTRPATFRLAFAPGDAHPGRAFQAIYPTVVIIFVALNKSHMEKGLTQHLESLPTPNITCMADRTSSSRDGERSPAELSVIDDGAVRHADIHTSEGAGRSWDEERKAEIV
ncbi:hypothetical protein GSI_09836 [Ganoderma sinense ZZ0214-1]|uniref:Uncharacterized protein n=1 Tax=Ganoderma sinense ZZ0214-1 TaxID=1077348 RepID=A0A2G8S2V4_9APHY|nr:hypothetical protein GSI_09836 [Ganoderma sinense ZZ0214-1]